MSAESRRQRAQQKRSNPNHNSPSEGIAKSLAQMAAEHGRLAKGQPPTRLDSPMQRHLTASDPVDKALTALAVALVDEGVRHHSVVITMTMETLTESTEIKGECKTTIDILVNPLPVGVKPKDAPE